MRRTAILQLSALPLVDLLTFPFFLLFALLCLPSLAHASGEVVAEPPVVTPGQTVKLRWYFTGTKVVVSGGKFGTGQVVTGKMVVTDTPRKTTQYRFDVYYTVAKPADNGEIISEALHQRYSVTALVDDSPPDHFKTFTGNRGWKIDFLADWHCDISTQDDGYKALMFFQKEFDSVERMAVATLPADSHTAAEIMAKALADTPGHYQNLKIEPAASVTIRGVAGSAAQFSGDDDSHPGVRTTSLLYTVVYAGRAYVLSARTRASGFLMRRSHLEHMLKSFVLPNSAPGDALPATIKRDTKWI